MPSRSTVVLPRLIAVLLAAPAAAEDRAEPAPLPRVPEGFSIELAAGAPDLRFPMFGAIDDAGRLYVAESSGLDLYAELQALTRKCRIRVLEDGDGDGRYERSRVFIEGLVFPMGLAWREGALYVADPPELAVYRDRDGDGAADERRVLLSGFGHQDNGSLHGLVFGPDGLLYMTLGSPDGYRIVRDDGVEVSGKSGALLRCRPDGGGQEVLCRGFTNLVEVVFLPSGEVIGTDNWFQQPEGGLRDALVQLAEGGLYPLEHDSGSPQPSTGVALPPLALFPAVALSGLARLDGAALPELRGQLVSAQHNARKVERHVLARSGAGFIAEHHDLVGSDDPDFHPSDVLEDADGSLLVIDTGGWYVQHCPTGRIRASNAPGAVYRVRSRAAARAADPLGRGIEWEKASPEALAALLGDGRGVVRERAARELRRSGRSAVDALADAIRGPAPAALEARALWCLGAIDDAAALAPLRAALDGGAIEAAAAAARILGRRRDRESSPALARLLSSPHAPLRLAAAEALARCGGAGAVPALAAALADASEPLLEHACAHALFHLAASNDLKAALAHPSPRVQRAALVLLDQAPRLALGVEAVLARVDAADRALRDAARGALERHPEWAPHAARLIGEWLARPRLAPEDAERLASCLLGFASRPEIAALAAEAFSAAGSPPARRRFLAEAFGRFDGPELPPPWRRSLAQALEDADAAVRGAAARSIATLGLEGLDHALLRLAEREHEAPAARLDALRAAAARADPSTKAIEFLLDQLAGADDPLLRLAAAETLGRLRLDAAQLAALLRAARAQTLFGPSTILEALRRSAGEASAPAIIEYLEGQRRAGWRPRTADLDGLVAALPEPARARRLLEAGEGEDLAEKRAYLESLEGALEGGDASRGREVFFAKDAACASCHRIAGAGGEVGPDLTRIGAARSARDLLESIVFPSSTFAQGYETYLAIERDGAVAFGTLDRRSAEAVRLREASGALRRLRRERLRELSPSPSSLMPEGLEKALGRERLRDLIAFLKSRT
jgi:putative membrane-bound dehydrogenase-like protein